ncbi:MAG: alpha/beta hydrolase [Eubacteriales bacterium]|nr:alpha/beta hydrolase [Eubacteriales bacterium]
MRIEIGGISINYECIGSGAPVLLLHGWGADIAAMMPIANEVARLGKMAVCVDFPGFGKSDLPPAAWGVREYADTTKALIDKLGIRGCDLVCHSFGGRVTIMLAAEDETLFKRLVLVDAAGIRPKRTIKYYIKTYSYKLAKRLARIKLVNKAFRLDAKIKSAGSDEYKSLSGVMRETFVKVVNLDLTDKLDKIKNETLLIWGENDTATPLYMGRLMEKKIERAGLAVIENAGHFSYADDYPRFCSILDIMLMD